MDVKGSSMNHMPNKNMNVACKWNEQICSYGNKFNPSYV